MSPYRPLCLIAAALVAGCGRAPGLAEGLAAGALGALADWPAIDAQIAKASLGRDAFGTRVSRMPAPGREKAVTFMTYKALDNDLGGTRADHLNVLEKAGSNAAVNVVAVTDEAGPDNTVAYYVRRDADPAVVTSPYMPIWPGERDTGSPVTLAEAVRWGFDTYPAKLTWLDVNNHGQGAFGIASDDRSRSGIELPALAAALEVGNRERPLDVVSFDACRMATIELAYELRGAARIVVASEDDSLAVGMNYDRTIEALEQRETTAPGLARALVLRAERRGANRAVYALSALDLSRAEAAAQAVDRLAGALIAAVPAHGPAMRAAIDATPRFFLANEPEKASHRDLAALTRALKAGVPDPAVRRAADGVIEALFGKQKLVMAALGAAEQKGAAEGVSIHVRTDGQVDRVYARTSFAADTRWDEFLRSLRAVHQP